MGKKHRGASSGGTRRSHAIARRNHLGAAVKRHIDEHRRLITLRRRRVKINAGLRKFNWQRFNPFHRYAKCDRSGISAQAFGWLSSRCSAS
jgi:hypothetical protein